MTFAPNFTDVNVRPCPMHELLSLEGRLFVESCEVKDLEGEEAQQVVAECLAGPELELAA
jgi:hypothetical protein